MPTPKEMNHSTLLKIARVEVDAAIWELPGDVRAILERVPVFLERRPDAEDIAAGIEGDTLGIFEEGAAASPTPRIRLWVENLWEVAEGEVASLSRGSANHFASRNWPRSWLGRAGPGRAGLGLTADCRRQPCLSVNIARLDRVAHRDLPSSGVRTRFPVQQWFHVPGLRFARGNEPLPADG